MIHIAVGTLNRAKLNAVNHALKQLKTTTPLLDCKISLAPLAAPSQVSEMPLSLEEIQKGAFNRALFSFKNTVETVKYSIGMEGGVFLVPDPLTTGNIAILQNWVYIYNGKTGAFGCSAGLPLPHNITQALFNEGRELAEVIDSVSGEKDVRSKNGAFGILTADLYKRDLAFSQAIINAWQPLINNQYYPLNP